MALKPRVMRLKINARIMPPTSVAKISPAEYRNVTFREFHRYFAPLPVNSQIQFFGPTQSHVGLSRFQSVKLICTSLATG